MAILVDALREYPGSGLPFRSWCHMATDGSWEELHAFAARLGLRRAWFQGDHYDLPPHGRAAAVALGAEEVGTGELLERMLGPRGERARRRVLSPSGVAWLRGGGGPAVLRYPPGALVVVGGPPGAGKSTLAARAVDRRRVPVLELDDDRASQGEEWGDALRRRRGAVAAALAAGSGAVAVTTALRDGHRRVIAGVAAAAGVGAHLVLVDATPEECRAGRAAQRDQRIPDGLLEHLLREWAALRRDLGNDVSAGDFDSVVVADRAAVNRLRRLALSPSSEG